MMSRPMQNWKRSTALVMTLLTFGCETIPKSGGYPTWPIPERPEVAIRQLTVQNRQPPTEYCLSGEDLRQLNGYVVKLEDLAHKYECEITIINGKPCSEGR